MELFEIGLTVERTYFVEAEDENEAMNFVLDSPDDWDFEEYGIPWVAARNPVDDE